MIFTLILVCILILENPRNSLQVKQIVVVIYDSLIIFTRLKYFQFPTRLLELIVLHNTDIDADDAICEIIFFQNKFHVLCWSSCRK